MKRKKPPDGKPWLSFFGMDNIGNKGPGAGYDRVLRLARRRMRLDRADCSAPRRPRSGPKLFASFVWFRPNPTGSNPTPSPPHFLPHQNQTRVNVSGRGGGEATAVRFRRRRRLLPPGNGAAGRRSRMKRKRGSSDETEEEHPQRASRPKDKEPLKWISKDHFAAKRLHFLVEGLNDDIKNLIREKSASAALLDVSPFHIPNKLIDFIAENTTPALREFKFGSKSFVFTKEMVRKVYGVRCSDRPVQQLNKSKPHDLREVYKAGKNIPDIQHAIDLLKKCKVTDEETVLRSWDLICLATVVSPGGGNNLSLDYIASMEDPTKTHEFAWDEHLLELAMQEVQKIQDKKASPKILKEGKKKLEFWIIGPYAMLGIVYMDHLKFPPNDHVFDYSVPRVCHVTSDDFKFVVKTDIEKKMLLNTTIFGRRPFRKHSLTPYGEVVAEPVEQPVEEPEVNPSASLNEWLLFPSSQEFEVPTRFKHLHDKHKALFAADVDTTLKNFAVGLKNMQSQRMSALLIDVEAALEQEDGPILEFQTVPAAGGGQNMGDVGSEDQGNGNEGGDTEDAEAIDSEATDDEVVPYNEANAEVPDVEARDDEKRDSVEAEKEAEESVEAGKEAEVHVSSTTTDVPQAAVILDSSTVVGGDAAEQQVVDSLVRSPRPVSSPFRATAPAGYSQKSWDAAPDPPPFELFSQDDYVPDTSAAEKPAATTCLDMANSSEATASLSPSKNVEVPSVEVVEAATPVLGSKNVEVPQVSADVLVQDDTPQESSKTDVVTEVAEGKDASTGIETLEKRNRQKRAAKGELTPPKVKKIKVCQDVVHTYNKFICYGRRYKRQKRGKKAAEEAPKTFVKIGRYYCSYRSFRESFRPHQHMSNEVMSVWCEMFNRVAKTLTDQNPRSKKKFTFSAYTAEKLAVDPAIFNPACFMKEFKEICSKFRILKGDLLYFPVVAEEHWVIPCINLLTKQFHIFDSMLPDSGVSNLDRVANNVLSNFMRTANESNVCNIDFGTFSHFTPEHPQQITLYDCGFYNILFMEHYNCKVMSRFENDVIPDLRKVLAATLIKSRDNKADDVEKLMEDELMFS